MPDVNQQLESVAWQDTGQVNSPQPKRQKSPWRVPLIAGCVLLLLIVATVLVVRSIVKKRASVEMVAQEMAEANFDCQSARDEVKCLASVPQRLAKETGDAQYCALLEDTALDTCLSNAAQSSKDWDLCKEIQDEAKESLCKDAVLSLLHSDDDPIELCAYYVNEERRRDCVESGILAHAVAGDCSSPSVEAFCDAGAELRAAMDAQDPDLCASVSDSYFRSYCEAVVSPGDRDFDNLDADEEVQYGTDDRNTDSDGDGLMDGEEVHQYGTSPINADTDGDGFDDKTELDNGFDPLVS